MGVLRTLMCVAVAATLVSVAMAATYTVGSPNGGWDTSTNLQAWATSQSFSVGDNLVFQYMPNHDVNEVTKTDYDSCQTSNPIQIYTGGNTAVPLSSPGKRYFICGTMGHCSQGMKVEIDTLATSAPPPVATPLTPPPTSPTTHVPSPPMHSPMSPLSPPKSPLSSPTSSPIVPSTESPMNSPSPNGSTPPPPPSSATKTNSLVGFTVGFSVAMAMLLGL